MLIVALHIALACVSLAVLLTSYRLLRGPSAVDRVLAVDTLYVNAIALIVLLGIERSSELYFEAALVVALMGFVGTVALCKFVLRGDIVE